MTIDGSDGAWGEVQRLFAGALERDPVEWAAFLAAEDADPAVRTEVLRLLRAHRSAGDFLSAFDSEMAAALVGAEAADPPDAIGPYRVIRPLARGGMGLVFLARDERLDRPVALKCLPSWLSADPAARERFTAEARAASALDHPNVATIHDVGETPDGGLYIAMSYYEGETLADRIGRGPLPLDEALRIADEIADGLAAAHAHGIVHRDVKPANVMLTPEGRAKILDFGIAKGIGSPTTRQGLRLGTISSMSPEQTRGDGVDAGTDVWSFGVLLYEMLTGRRPFRGDTDAVVVHAIRHDAPPAVDEIRPEIPPAVARVVARCLEKDPECRYADAAGVRAALRGDGARTSRFRVGRRLARTVLGLGALGLAGAAGAVALRWLPDAGPVPGGELEPQRVLVLPFSAAPDDTALARLGRDLMITLNTSLDGLGELRTVGAATTAARASSWDPGRGLAPGFELARDLGAGRVVHGNLVRTSEAAATEAPPGIVLRVDLSVYRTDPRGVEARTVARAGSGDIGALTDSVTWALVRKLWPSDRAPAVEASALATRPVAALRAYIDGELATAENRWREAPAHFARAVRLDSTFWLARWRYVDAMRYRARPVDSADLAILRAHRLDLPARERALLDARSTDSLSERLASALAVTERYPDSWRAWFDYGDALVHDGMFLGRSVGEARSAMERAVALNPTSSTHWQHLFWLALADRDTAATGLAIRRLAALRLDSTSVHETGLDALLFSQYLHELAVRRGEPDSATVNALADQITRYSGPLDLERISGEVSAYGFHRGEIALSEALLERPVPASARAGALRAIPQALAGRGAWDSALVALDRYVAEVDGVVPLQHAVRLSVVGSWLGTLPPDAGASWRTALGRHADGLDAGARHELAWLDGLAAYARTDADGLAAARRRLDTADGDSAVASLLSRSLGAFALALAGRPSAAADSMLALERARAERYWFRTVANRHPYLTAVDRLAASGWLLEARRPGEAAPLLRWHEAVQFPSHLAARADASVRGMIQLRRGDVQEALGRPDRAAAHYRLALEELDLPTEPLRPVVEGIRAALGRSGLSGRDEPEGPLESTPGSSR